MKSNLKEGINALSFEERFELLKILIDSFESIEVESLFCNGGVDISSENIEEEKGTVVIKCNV